SYEAVASLATGAGPSAVETPRRATPLGGPGYGEAARAPGRRCPGVRRETDRRVPGPVAWQGLRCLLALRANRRPRDRLTQRPRGMGTRRPACRTLGPPSRRTANPPCRSRAPGRPLPGPPRRRPSACRGTVPGCQAGSHRDPAGIDRTTHRTEIRRWQDEYAIAPEAGWPRP